MKTDTLRCSLFSIAQGLTNYWVELTRTRALYSRQKTLTLSLEKVLEGIGEHPQTLWKLLGTFNIFLNYGIQLPLEVHIDL